ncbi:hypothetical protein TCAL_15868 [Tigriopus californicus]|uniref:RNA-directed DNA polymerase n=1 Tax=Tigriopus californicus TaxID=6832 RepID=A0A553NPH8_TIGCA|nr:hypothetical protein TCAL_15868 [Tigriopus californicus]
MWDRISVEDGILHLDGHRIIVPRGTRSEILARLHESHQGITLTRARARKLFMWPGILNDIVQLMSAWIVYLHFGNSFEIWGFQVTFAVTVWRNVSRKDGLSPAQWVFGRPIRTRLPAHFNTYQPLGPSDIEEGEEKRQRYCSKQRANYNQSAGSLPALHIGTPVWIQDTTNKLWNNMAVIEEIRNRFIWSDHAWHKIQDQDKQRTLTPHENATGHHRASECCNGGESQTARDPLNQGVTHHKKKRKANGATLSPINNEQETGKKRKPLTTLKVVEANDDAETMHGRRCAPK